jgi:competence protein ComEC
VSLSRNSLILIVSPLALALAGAFVMQQYRLAHPGEFRAHFLDVGQGDSALLVTPSGRQVLIDGGPDLSALRGVARHMPLLDRSIDLLVLSHAHLDHLAAFPEILRRYRVGAILMTGTDTSLPRYAELLTLVKQQNIPIFFADPQRDIDLGDGVMLDVLWPPPVLTGRKMKDENDASVVLRASYGSGSILFTGDAGEDPEHAMLAAGVDVKAGILKVGHHGSKHSTSTGFLLAVNPTLAVISSGSGNTYGHPHPVILQRLRHFGVPVRITQEEGDISVAWDD